MAAINPLIPLQANADLSQGINTLTQTVRDIPEMRAAKAEAKARRTAAMGEAEKARIGNAALLGEQLIPVLEAGDTQQAQSIIQNFSQIDSEFSEDAGQLLQRDPRQLMQMSQRAIDLNQRIQGEGKDAGKIGTFNPRDFTVESFSEFMKTRDPSVLKRFESQREVNIGGVPHRFDPSTGGFFPAEVDQSGQRRQVTAADVGESEATITEAKEGAKVRGKSGAEKQANFPKAQEAFARLQDKWGFVDQKIDEALNEIGPLTTGFGGAVLSKIPASQARDLRATLDTIRANIGFDELQQMRDASPTGGALGQVSEMENRLLQAVKGSLEQDQSPEQLAENLQDIKAMLQRVRSRKERAFQSDFQDRVKGQQGQQGGQIQLDPETESLVNKYSQ